MFKFYSCFSSEYESFGLQIGYAVPIEIYELHLKHSAILYKYRK